ncbi:MAG: alcohol dehydrogenase catalytic domain-containing protein [Candidatus Omnitrophica bacterium]|nr:alcohol dehydrogenase catalytic domain-containing protein [Candidatus Omnitrophota bacterium]
MKAIVKYGQGPDMVELRDVPEPKIRPGTVMIEVQRAAVCGWDIEMWKHTMANPVKVPVIQGHEFCGVIAEVGDGVRDWQVGDRVACETSAEVCGKCYSCRTGDYQVCPERRGYGYGVDGAFTRYVVARKEILHRIPAGLGFDEASLTEPFCVVHHALSDPVKVIPGDTSVIIGPGPIGIISCQMARLMGAARTVLVGMQNDVNRMSVAKTRNWADFTINVSETDPVKAITEITEGKGADLAIDCAGNTPAFSTALESVRRNGRVVKIGWGPKPFNQSLDVLLRKSLTVYGTFGHNWHNWEAVLGLFTAKRLDPAGLISGVVPLAGWHEAFEKVHSTQAVKMVLAPNQ